MIFIELGIVVIFLGIGPAFAKIGKHALCDIYKHETLYGGPVCGSDHNTYENIKYFRCVNKGLRIKVLYNGFCYDGIPDCELNGVYDPVCGNDGLTYPHIEAMECLDKIVEMQVGFNRSGPCEDTDPCINNYSDKIQHDPVCGTNGVTYENSEQIACLRRFGSNLRVLHDDKCKVEDVKKIFRTRTIVCEMAMNSFEWNPVCGSDGVTYPSPYLFACLQPKMKYYYNAECKSDLQLACARAHDNDRLINGLPIKPDYPTTDKYCGNDGVTYASKDHLECERRNNKYLLPKHKGPCQGISDDPCTRIINYYDRNSPVCGSDGVTYICVDAVWCVKRRWKPHLKILHNGVCLRPKD